jgi:hypothetical protein
MRRFAESSRGQHARYFSPVAQRSAEANPQQSLAALAPNAQGDLVVARGREFLGALPTYA